MAGRRRRLTRDIAKAVADAFDKVGLSHCHKRQQNVPLAAAMLMFLESSTEAQRDKIKQVLWAEVDESMETLVQNALDAHERADGREPGPSSSKRRKGGR